jgi:hypothetical protein
MWPRAAQPFVRDLEKSRQSRRGMRGEAKSFGRSSIGAIWPFAGGLQGYPARVLRKGWLFGQLAPMWVLRIAYGITTISSARPRGARPI